MPMNCLSCAHNKDHTPEDEPCNTCINKHRDDMTCGPKWEPIQKIESLLKPEREIISPNQIFRSQDPGTRSVGMNFDSGKPPLSRVPRVLLDEVAKVLEFGSKKYAWDNWRNGISYHRVASAAMRHLTAFMDCETMDSESSLQHLSHAACRIAFLLEYEKYPEKFKDFDDRFSYLSKSVI